MWCARLSEIVGLLFVISFASPVAAESLNKTTIEGPILFRDLDGKEISPPYDEQTIDGLLAAETLDYESRLPVGSPPPVNVTVVEQDLIRYRYDVVLRRDRLRLRFDFNYGGFETHDEIELLTHRGTLPDRQLVIRRSYPDRVSRVRAVMQGLNSPNLLENDIDHTLHLIEGLINDPMGEDGDVNVEKAERYEDYMRAVELMAQVMRQKKALSPEISLRIATLHERTSFTMLPVQEQFDILSGFAYWFARSPTPDQQIQSTLTHGGLARIFFEMAYELAFDVNDISPIDASALIRTLQEQYKFECPTEEDIALGDASWGSTCFYTLYDAGYFDRRFSPRTYEAILSDFHYHLETASRPETGWATECEYRRKIAAERSDMTLYWELYAELAEAIAAKHRRIALEMSFDRDFEYMSYIAKTFDRARDIEALNGAGGRMVTTECASEPNIQPAGDEL